MYRRFSLVTWAVVILLVSAGSLRAAPRETDGRAPDDVLLLKLRLDGIVFEPILAAYASGGQILLPVGQIARLLELGVTVTPDGIARGSILEAGETFELNARLHRVRYGDTQFGLRPESVYVDVDDVYLAAPILSRIWPITFRFDRKAALLVAEPRETLPIQLRLKREQRRVGGAEWIPPEYPEQPVPYRLLRIPFLDQTLSARYRRVESGEPERVARYTSFLAGEVLWHSTSAYFTGDSDEPFRDYRVTLGRSNPDPNELGPLRAREYRIGDLDDPGADLIDRARHLRGALVSSFPLHAPQRLGTHSFRGPLPPGWEVELYRNEVLLGYQGRGEKDEYVFDDMPLYPGVNRFVLRFYGPQGQVREDVRIFNQNEAFRRPGEVYYRLLAGYQDDGLPGFQADADREPSATGQVDFGLAGPFSGTLYGASLPLGGTRSQFFKAGLRANWQALWSLFDYARAHDGGEALHAGGNLAFGRMNLYASYVRLMGFRSGLFPASPDPLAHRATGRVDWLPFDPKVLPLGVGHDVVYDTFASGQRSLRVGQRLTFSHRWFSLANEVNWNVWDLNADDQHYADGSLYLSRRLSSVGLSAGLQYGVYPLLEPHTGTLNVDWRFAPAWFASAGTLWSFLETAPVYNAGLFKESGAFTAGVNLRGSSADDLTAELSVSFSVGHGDHLRRWYVDARPAARSGSLTVRVFVDRNDNGAYDEGETPVPGIVLRLNDSDAPVTTSTTGVALLTDLIPHVPVSLSIAAGSLPDTTMQPAIEGVRVTPRPGMSAVVEFPVRLVGEVDGTVYVVQRGSRQTVGGLLLELIDAKGRTVKTEYTAYDGYYWFHGIPPGTYTLRPAADDLARRRLPATGGQRFVIEADGTVFDGVDFVLGTTTDRVLARSSSAPAVDAPRPVATPPARSAPSPQPPTPPVAPPPLAPVAAPAAARPDPAAQLTASQRALFKKLQAGESVVLEGVQFLTGTSFPAAGALQNLDDLVAVARAVPTAKIELHVYTDIVGTPEQMQSLSEQRGRAVERYLRSKGVALPVRGKGNTKLLTISFSFKGKEKNNRVEAVLAR